MCRYTRETMSAQPQPKPVFKPSEITIFTSEEPMMKAMHIEWTIFEMAKIAGYTFVSRETTSFPSKYYRLTMIRIKKDIEGVIVHTYPNKVVVCKKDKCVEIDVNDLEEIYGGLQGVAEMLGFKEYTMINDTQNWEGVELHGYGVKVQVWINYECHKNECMPRLVLVKTEELEEEE